MKKQKLVHYIPKKFGSPAWLPLSQAEALLKEDTRLIESLIKHGAATEKDLPEIRYPKKKI